MKRWIAISILGILCLGLFLILEYTISELESTKSMLAPMQTELASAQAGLETTKEELNELKVSYNGLLSGHGYTIKDPTYREMMNFIKQDKTDRMQYVEDEYVCQDFAAEVCNNAEEKGIRCAYIIINYPDGGHAIVAFDTIDRGLIYVEPQHDELVKPVIGEHYYQCVTPMSGYYYEEPDYDDTIETILVIWSIINEKNLAFDIIIFSNLCPVFTSG